MGARVQLSRQRLQLTAAFFQEEHHNSGRAIERYIHFQLHRW